MDAWETPQLETPDDDCGYEPFNKALHDDWGGEQVEVMWLSSGF